MLQAKDLLLDHRADQTLQDHLCALREGDVDAIMADYSKNALLFTPDAVLRGRDEIRGFFEELLAALPPGSVLNVTQSAVDNELAYLVWNGESDELHIPLATETLVVRQGRIMRHSFAAQMEPKR
jgi:hypothetical protein